MFADPYRFNIDRPNLKDHVSFGFGIHTCIGNGITRSVVPMLLSELVRRFPNAVLVDTNVRPGSTPGVRVEGIWTTSGSS